jgi:hypothetical protein
MMSTKSSLWIGCCVSLAVLSLGTPLLGQFVYVTNYFSGDVSGYTINQSTGALTPIPDRPSLREDFQTLWR